jgi:hypothetical protein
MAVEIPPFGLAGDFSGDWRIYDVGGHRSQVSRGRHLTKSLGFLLLIH